MFGPDVIALRFSNERDVMRLYLTQREYDALLEQQSKAVKRLRTCRPITQRRMRGRPANPIS